MKRLTTPARRAPLDGALPMINLVFLLLAFFVASAVIAPPDAIETSPPTAQGGERIQATAPMLLGPEGEIAWREHRGDAAFTALAAHLAAGGDKSVVLRADGGAGAVHLARMLQRLRAIGAEGVSLAVRPGPGPISDPSQL